MSKSVLTVIGGGPGGYVAALRAAQLGFDVKIVEKRPTWGGTCLNEGCIPSKSLLHSSHIYEDATKHGKNHGLFVSDARMDIPIMHKQKNTAINQLSTGIEMLLKKAGVEFYHAKGEFLDKTGKNIGIVDENGNSSVLKTDKTIIATGSDANTLRGIPVDEKVIVTNKGALELKKVPQRLLVVGAGVIGLELGSVWRRLGAKVDVVEYLPRITPGMDLELSKQLQKYLKRQGMKFKLGTKLSSADIDVDVAHCVLENVKSGKQEAKTYDCVLLAIGRHPFTKGLGVETVGVEMDKWGTVLVDNDYQTNVDGVYAIGDVIPGPMLAHKAEDEGMVCVERISGMNSHVNYDAIPNIIYTQPEFAGIGKTEEELVEEGVAFKKGTFLMKANSRAKAVNQQDGMIKVLSSDDDRILGCHFLSTNASEAVAEAGLAVHHKMSLNDVIHTCHGHPTFSEAFREAVMDIKGEAIHKL
ncbi:hypothetical protein PCE1_001736 [Barthelona sp. PCE]